MESKSLQTKQNGSALVVVLTVVVLAAIGGIGAYVATGGFKAKDDKVSQNSQQTKDSSNFTAATATTGTAIRALLTGAKAGDYDIKCTLNYDKSAANNNALLSVSGPATLYISGATKMRIDLTISGKPGHFVRLGDSLYIWADGQKQGSKLPISDKSDSDTSKKFTSDSFVDNAEAYDLKCQSVLHLDAGLFTLPANVTFVDLNSQFNSSSSSN